MQENKNNAIKNKKWQYFDAAMTVYRLYINYI